MKRPSHSSLSPKSPETDFERHSKSFEDKGPNGAASSNIFEQNIDEKSPLSLVSRRAGAWHSKLCPFYEFIRKARLGRRTYAEIAVLLAAEHGIKAAPSTIHSFVRARRGKNQGREICAVPVSHDVAILPRPATSQKCHKESPHPQIVDAAELWNYSPNKPFTMQK